MAEAVPEAVIPMQRRKAPILCDESADRAIVERATRAGVVPSHPHHRAGDRGGAGHRCSTRATAPDDDLWLPLEPALARPADPTEGLCAAPIEEV